MEAEGKKTCGPSYFDVTSSTVPTSVASSTSRGGPAATEYGQVRLG